MMNRCLEMPVLELLMARLCHDLAGPIAAVGNGSEMLADEAPNVAAETLHLLVDSAGEAAGRLQFYRFAYGFGAGGAVSARAPAELAARFFSPTPIVCDYAASVGLLPSALQKLACNLLLVGADGLPKGGRLRVNAGASGPVLDADGETVGFSPELIAALNLRVPAAALTPRTVQAHFAGLLARDLGRRLIAGTAHPGRFRIGTAAAADPAAQDAWAPSLA
jgi:histidine phosphotransferase ChpT